MKCGGIIISCKQLKNMQNTDYNFGNIIYRRSTLHQAIGFDCEWVTENGNRQPIALLQLSTFDGFCGLFRLNLIKEVPMSLKVSTYILYLYTKAFITNSCYIITFFSIFSKKADYKIIVLGTFRG